MTPSCSRCPRVGAEYTSAPSKRLSFALLLACVMSCSANDGVLDPVAKDADARPLPTTAPGDASTTDRGTFPPEAANDAATASADASTGTDGAPSAPTVESMLETNDRIVSPTYDFAELERLLSESLTVMGGGGGMLLFHRGKLIYRQTFGVEPPLGDQPGGAPFTADSVVPIASASKWVSGIAVMALVERGLFRLDTKVAEVLPFVGGDKGDMTVRQLYTHSSGLEDEPTYHRLHALQSMELAARLIARDVPLSYESGSGIWYAGVGMQLVGAMAEHLSGQSWVELFDEVLGSKLRLERTHFYGYPGDAFGVPTSNPNIAGSVATSLNEYGKLIWLLLQQGSYRNTQVLQAATVQTLLESQTAGIPDEAIYRSPLANYAYVDPQLASWHTAIGSWHDTDENGDVSEFLSAGAWGCSPFIIPELELGGVFLPYNRKRPAHPVDPGQQYNPALELYFDALRGAIRRVVNSADTTDAN
jgi:CubicO group peptidase (beta-lactamase class C family)